VIEPDRNKKQYNSARRRFLTPLVARLLERELTRTGPELSRMLSERIVELFEAVCPAVEHVKPGQLVWKALDQSTRGGSKNETLRTVVLTLIDEKEACGLANGEGIPAIREKAVVRMCEEAYEQGAVLSTRDLAMILHTSDSRASQCRIKAEVKRGAPLPHTGILHDMGTTISHKVIIIRKVVCEGLDPAHAARATRHTQKAVDRYLKAFYRVQTLFEFKPESLFISQVTGMSKRLVLEYINIIESINTNETS